MRDLQFRLLSSRQRVHAGEVWGFKTRRGRWESFAYLQKNKFRLKNVIQLIVQPKSLMELERKKRTSQNSMELARFSKLVVKHLTHFFPVFDTAAAQHSLFSPLLSFSSLPLAFSPHPQPKPLCFCVSEAWPYGLI